MMCMIYLSKKGRSLLMQDYLKLPGRQSHQVSFWEASYLIICIYSPQTRYITRKWFQYLSKYFINWGDYYWRLFFFKLEYFFKKSRIFEIWIIFFKNIVKIWIFFNFFLEFSICFQIIQLNFVRNLKNFMNFLSEPQMKEFIDHIFRHDIEQKYYDKAKTWPRVMVGYFLCSFFRHKIKLISVFLWRK